MAPTELLPAQDDVPAAWHRTATAYPRDRCLHELFEDRAAAHPEATAAVRDGRTLSYRELSHRSAVLARRLAERGVAPGDPVGVCGSRSPEALIAFLGILKAGGAYVPLDDGLPPARLQAMAEDAGVHTAVLLPGATCRVRRLRARVELYAGGAVRTSEAVRTSDGVGSGDAAPGQAPPAPRPPAPGVTAADGAAVMFTSGTTGRPKPVVVPHRGIVRLALSDTRLRPPEPGDRVLHGYDLSSDASTIEIWSALLGGAALVLADRAELLSPPALERLIGTAGVTVAYLTTSVFHLVARSGPAALKGLRFVSAGGEVLDPRLAHAVLTACPDTTVCNFYGPTENSVVSTAHVLRRPPPDPADPAGAADPAEAWAEQPVPIGRPLANSTCHVLRPDGTPARIGETGELFVGGDGLALGYANDPEGTAARFADHPARPGERLYRTGDHASWRADGELEYRGRADRQLKLRGFRVEPEEVEARLRGHPAVGEAAVLVLPEEAPGTDGTDSTDGSPGPGSGVALTACVTAARAGGRVPLAELRADLAAWLPAQVVPSWFAELPEFPVGESGKVDRRRLAELAAARRRRPESGRAAAAPTGEPSALRDAVAAVWQSVLRVTPAPADDFFQLGGDSLLAAEVTTRTLQAVGADARHGSSLVRALLTDRTLAGYTSAVREALDGRPSVRRGSPVDFAAEARLGFTLPPVQGPPPRPHDPAQVLLTGATGFVGAFLLDRLLRQTRAVVHCPVRARDDAHAERRVLANLDRYGLGSTGLEERLRCFPGDLAAPGLGLDAGRAEALSADCDLVLHCGAQVNFLYPYSALRAANVQGTREVVRLAARRRVPVHFLSTVAVLAGSGVAGASEIAEDTPLDHADGLSMGYAESKWVAEGVLRDAAGQGLPVAVHRPYEVMGDQQRGACNTETALCSLFQLVTETGLAPDIALPMDFVPVDHLADAVVHLATARPADGRVYHVTSPRPALLEDVLRRLEAAGVAVRRVPYEQWVAALVRHVAQTPTSPAAPFVSLCVDSCNTAAISVKEMYLQGTFPRLGRDNTERDLAGSGLRCPPTDTELIDRCLAYLFSCGYLRRPPAVADTGGPGGEALR